MTPSEESPGRAAQHVDAGPSAWVTLRDAVRPGGAVLTDAAGLPGASRLDQRGVTDLPDPSERAREEDRRNDIADIRRVADTLQESEQRLREMIDGIPAFIYTMAPTGEPEFFNRPYLEYFGRTAEKMMDWALIGVIHPDDLAPSMAIWQNAVATGQDYSLEFRLRRADGVFRWFELRSRTVRDAGGPIIRSYGLLSDIDDRKRAERRLRRAMRARQSALRASASRMREIVDRVPGLVYTMTPAGEVELVNHRILEYFGRSLDELKPWAI